MDPLLTAAAGLSACPGLSRHSIISKAEWRFQAETESVQPNTTIIAARHQLQTVRCLVPIAAGCYELTVTLWKKEIPQKGPTSSEQASAAQPGPLPGRPFQGELARMRLRGFPIWYTFTAAEILSFVDAVHDKQPIHRTAEPVVPGLLILWKIWQEFATSHVTIQFHSPVYAGQPVSLLETDAGWEGRCDDVLAFTVRRKE